MKAQGSALKPARWLCPRDPQQRRSLCNPKLKVLGSKRPALGGVQRRSLWLGFGVKPNEERAFAGPTSHWRDLHDSIVFRWPA